MDEILDLRIPHGGIENTHTLLRGVAISTENKLSELLDARVGFDDQSSDRRKKLLGQKGWTTEQLESMYQNQLEKRKLSAEKAARAALGYYEVYKDEIHEAANAINNIVDEHTRRYGDRQSA